jgi:hypothetical protein
MFKFDWKDSLLVAAGFVVCVTATMLLGRLLDIEVSEGFLQFMVGATVLGFPLARRRIFGQPQLPEPRRGILWSALSVVGLLASIFGMALIAIFGPRLLGSADEVATTERAADEAPLFEVESTDPVETAKSDAAIDAALREMEAFDEQAEKAAIAARLAQRRTERLLAAWGLGLVALGAGAAFVRYPRRVA